jgi:hypothetical protein
MINKARLEEFYKDRGLYIAIGSCILYIFILRPQDGNLPIYNNKIAIYTLSIGAIAASAVYCNQVRNSSKELMKNLEDKFYHFLMDNGITGDLLRLYRWNGRIGLLTITSYALFCGLLFFGVLGEAALGLSALLPIFFTAWILSEYAYANWLGSKLDELNLQYKRDHQ